MQKICDFVKKITKKIQKGIAKSKKKLYHIV